MNWKDIASTVGSIAGAVGPLLGGPVGLAVSIGSQIAGALGTENTPDAVAAALRTDPAAALKLQEWAKEEREQIRQANIELQRIALDEHKAILADRQNARTQHGDHWMPAVLTLILVAMFAGQLTALFIFDIPDKNRDLLVYLSGNFVPFLAAAVAYWVSSTKDAAQREKLMSMANQGQHSATGTGKPGA
jgi:hypothetical protein